jgi:hypothetical protein
MYTLLPDVPDHPPLLPKPACSFCGKAQDEVRKLVAGPTVYICEECVRRF